MSEKAFKDHLHKCHGYAITLSQFPNWPYKINENISNTRWLCFHMEYHTKYKYKIPTPHTHGGFYE